MAINIPPDPSDGTIAPASWGDAARETLIFLTNPPACEVSHSASLGVASGSWVAHAFNTETLDTDTMHDNATFNTRITIKTAGLYIVTCGVGWASNATGYRGVGIRKNAGATGPTHGGSVAGANPAAVHYQTTARTIKLAVNDYLEVMVLQTSGGALNSNLGDGLPYFTATWIGLG